MRSPSDRAPVGRFPFGERLAAALLQPGVTVPLNKLHQVEQQPSDSPGGSERLQRKRGGLRKCKMGRVMNKAIGELYQQ